MRDLRSLLHGRCSIALGVMMAVCTISAGARAAPASPVHYRVVGYDMGTTPIAPKDVGKIDILIFAFAKIVDGSVMLDAAATQRLRKRVALKKSHPGLKVDVSVGGWGAGGFSEAAATAEGRQRFADSAAQMLVANDADGLDVDWEYPGHSESGIASSPRDRQHFTAMLRTLRRTLDRVGKAHGRVGRKHFLLSIAIADGSFVDHIDIAAISPSVDWFNLMTYDFVNAMTPTTGHHSGLYASSLAAAGDRSVNRAVRQFLAAGVPPHKLMIGAAFYGREFAGVTPAQDGLYQPFEHFEGTHSWADLKTHFIDRNGYVRHWDAKAQAPWLWNAQTHHFISYDDPQSLAAKTAYVKAHHLGGIMYWEQSQDPRAELLDAVWQGLR